MTITAAAARHRTLWLLTLHGLIRPPDPAAGAVWQEELDRLIGEGRARPTPDGRIEALPHPRASKWTPEAEAAIVQATKLIQSTLGATGAPIRSCRALAAEWGLSPEAAAEARQRLIADGLVRVTDTNATAAVMAPPPPLSVTPESLGLVRRQQPRPKPAPSQTAPSQMAPPASAPPARVPPPATAAAAKPEPLEPVVQPAPAEPVRQPKLSRSPVRAERPMPKPKPAPAAATPASVAAAAALAADDADAGALLRRLVHAAEVSAGLAEPPTRIRTPLGSSPMLDTTLRLCVVLHGAGRPMLAAEISRGHLTPGQREWLAPALADGVRRGAFTATGGRGGRGARYSLSDPTVFDGVTWESLHAAVEAQRQARERRRAG